MKKNFLLAGAMLLALGSCTNEINEEGFVDKTNAISFNAYANKTRAIDKDVTTDNMTGDNFGVVGYTSDNSIYLYKNTNEAVEQQWVSSSNSWEYKEMGDLKFWPEGAMDFYAYFPSSDDATFENSNSTGNVMTISDVDCTHDVLFAYQGSQTKTVRVPLTFYHAFSKIMKLQIEMPSEGTLFKSNCQVEVKDVEFINTSTSGNIKVNNAGIASYDSPTTPLSTTLSPVVTIHNSNTTGTLIDNGTDAKGYLFATNSSTTATKNVKGTGKTMWDGDKASLSGGKLSEKELVCLKLTCKVWNGADEKKYYYVGGASSYGEIYIPITGSKVTSTVPSDADKTALLAGKRYTYKIVMKDNVGYTDAGDPILTPILFEVSSVTAWDDVTITITL